MRSPAPTIPEVQPMKNGEVNSLWRASVTPSIVNWRTAPTVAIPKPKKIIPKNDASIDIVFSRIRSSFVAKFGNMLIWTIFNLLCQVLFDYN